MTRLILFNKPFQVLCQFRDNDGRPVLGDYIPLPDVYPAGRLDHDSEGLLLLTDNGPLQHRIADPRWKLSKTYWVQVEGDISDAALAALRRGVVLNDGPTLPAEAERLPVPDLWARHPPIRFRASLPTSWISLTIREGRNRQVRRMTAAVGFPTLRLVRRAIGPWTVDGLAPGEWKSVTIDQEEMRRLFGAAAGEPQGKSPRPPGKRNVDATALSPSDLRPRRRSPSPRPSAPPRPPTPSSRKARGS